MYIPKPVDTKDIALPPEIEAACERLAKNTHDVWARGRMNDGWSYGAKHDDDKKLHPCLVPYDELSESEKEYDRNTSIEAIKLLIALRYKIVK